MSRGPFQVVRESPNRLSRHRWVFSLEGNLLFLDRYHYEKRRRKSDGFKLAKFYDSEGDEGGYGEWEWLSESEVPWDEDIRGEALASVVNQIHVLRRSDMVHK